MTLDLIQNDTNLQIIQERFKQLSQLVDNVGNQVKQFEKDNIQHIGQKSSSYIIQFLKEISKIIETMISQLSQEQCADQQFRSTQNEIELDIKREQAYEQIQIQALSSIEQENKNYLQSPQKAKHTPSKQQNQKLKQQKSVQFYNDAGFYTEERTQSKANNIEKNLKQRKSILKKLKTLDKSDIEKILVEDMEIDLTDTDFYEVKNNKVITNLIQSQNIYPNNQDQYIYSELVTKLSKSGQQQLKIICMAGQFFYVFPEQICDTNFKSFLIKDINEIIFDVQEKQKCSIVIKKEFQLNLKTNHRQELVQYIFRVFKYQLNALQPMIYYKQDYQSIQNPQKKPNKSPMLTNSTLRSNLQPWLDSYIMTIAGIWVDFFDLDQMSKTSKNEQAFQIN
ncbi:hypothetical protein ABPG73_021973 [Tetrahymena malaccensis]